MQRSCCGPTTLVQAGEREPFDPLDLEVAAAGLLTEAVGVAVAALADSEGDEGREAIEYFGRRCL